MINRTTIIDANINSKGVIVLEPPNKIKAQMPSDETDAQIVGHREKICSILDGNDSRMVMIVGPCSIHDPEAALEYAGKLAPLVDHVSDVMFVVMRAYFAKPRTTVGWKGIFYDPDMNGTNNVTKGTKITREVARTIAGMGLPLATEVLDPYMIQYIDDLVSWCCIGARTAESQMHREIASGLTAPVGIKNPTSNSIKAAADAIQAANHPHGFWGMNEEDGRVALFPSKGNGYAHLVLRGGDKGANYKKEAVAHATELLRERGLRSKLIIDCSHGNSMKDYKRQPEVLADVIRQRKAGNADIAGVMLESNLTDGNQRIPKNLSELHYGKSVTDGCLGWEDTVRLILGTAKQLRAG